MKKRRRIGGALLLLTSLYVGANVFMDRKYNKPLMVPQTPKASIVSTEDYESVPKVPPIFDYNIQLPRPVEESVETFQDSISAVIRKIRVPSMRPLVIEGRSLEDYFEEFNALTIVEQEGLVKGLDFSTWDIVLLTRYIPIDGILRGTSSFYGTDYKWHLQILFSESTINPIAVGPTNDYGLGQIQLGSEEWARSLYGNPNSGYMFPGEPINDNIYDPHTNLVLSSIIYRRAAEMDVLGLGALYSFYTNGWEGLDLNQDGVYATSEFGLNDVTRAKSFDMIARDLIITSWVSMDRRDLIDFIQDPALRALVELNEEGYDGQTAYQGMFEALDGISGDSNNPKYNMEIFRGEAYNNTSNWLKIIYGVDASNPSNESN